MDEIDNRDEKEKRPKEYYQINLDMGRIFWIVFLLGLVVIGIFVLGFFVGGGKEKNNPLSINRKSKKESGEVLVKKIFGEEKPEGQSSKNKNELDIQEIFKEHPEGELQVVNKKSVQEAFKNTQQEAIQPESSVKKQYAGKIKPAMSKTNVYRPVGNYYIQVASFVKKENALKLKSKLEKNMYKVEVVKAVVNGKTYYRVRVGPFSSSMVAKNTMIAMKRRFNLSSPFIVKKNS